MEQTLINKRALAMIPQSFKESALDHALEKSGVCGTIYLYVRKSFDGIKYALGLENDSDLLIVTSITNALTGLITSIVMLQQETKENKSTAVKLLGGVNITTSVASLLTALKMIADKCAVAYVDEKIQQYLPELIQEILDGKADDVLGVGPRVNADMAFVDKVMRKIVSIMMLGLITTNTATPESIIKTGNVLRANKIICDTLTAETASIATDILGIEDTIAVNHGYKYNELIAEANDLLVMKGGEFINTPHYFSRLKSLPQRITDCLAKSGDKALEDKMSMYKNHLSAKVKPINDKIVELGYIDAAEFKQVCTTVNFDGPPGVGKTELAAYVRKLVGVRLQYGLSVYDLATNAAGGNKYFQVYSGQRIAAYEEWLANLSNDPLLPSFNNLTSRNVANLEGAALSTKHQASNICFITLTSNAMRPISSLTAGGKFTRDTIKAVWSRILHFEIRDELLHDRDGPNLHRKADFSHLDILFCPWVAEGDRGEIKLDAQGRAEFVSVRKTVDEMVSMIADDIARKEIKFLNDIMERVPEGERQILIERLAFLNSLLIDYDQARGNRVNANSDGDRKLVLRFDGPVETGKSRAANILKHKFNNYTRLRWLHIKSLTELEKEIANTQMEDSFYILDDIVNPQTYEKYVEFYNSVSNKSVIVICTNDQPPVVKPGKLGLLYDSLFRGAGANYVNVDVPEHLLSVTRRLGFTGIVRSGKHVAAISTDVAMWVRFQTNRTMTLMSTDGPITLDEVFDQLIAKWTNLNIERGTLHFVAGRDPDPPAVYDVAIEAPDYETLKEVLSNARKTINAYQSSYKGVTVRVSEDFYTRNCGNILISEWTGSLTTQEAFQGELQIYLSLLRKNDLNATCRVSLPNFEQSIHGSYMYASELTEEVDPTFVIGEHSITCNFPENGGTSVVIDKQDLVEFLVSRTRTNTMLIVTPTRALDILKYFSSLNENNKDIYNLVGVETRKRTIRKVSDSENFMAKVAALAEHPVVRVIGAISITIAGVYALKKVYDLITSKPDVERRPTPYDYYPDEPTRVNPVDSKSKERTLRLMRKELAHVMTNAKTMTDEEYEEHKRRMRDLDDRFARYDTAQWEEEKRSMIARGEAQRIEQWNRGKMHLRMKELEEDDEDEEEEEYERRRTYRVKAKDRSYATREQDDFEDPYADAYGYETNALDMGVGTITKIQSHAHVDIPNNGKRYRHSHLCDKCNEVITHTHKRRTEEESKKYGHVCKKCKAQGNKTNMYQNTANASEETTVWTNFTNKIRNNWATAHGTLGTAHCFGLHGRTWVGPGHIVTKPGEVIKLTVDEGTYRAECIWRNADQDKALFLAESSMKMVKDITKDFVSCEMLGRSNYGVYVRFEPNGVTMTCHASLSPIKSVVKAESAVDPIWTLRKNYITMDLAVFNGPKKIFKDGDCGMPVLVYQDGRVLIAGFHVGYNEGTMTGFFTTLTKNEAIHIKGIDVANVTNAAPILPHNLVPTPELEKAITGSVASEYANIKTTSTYKFLAKDPKFKNPSVPKHRKKYLPPLSPKCENTVDFSPITCDNRILNQDAIYANVYGKKDMLMTQLLKCTEKNPFTPTKALNQAFELVSDKFAAVYGEARLWSTHEAINGVTDPTKSGWGFSNRIEMDASAGPTAKYLFGCQNKKTIFEPMPSQPGIYKFTDSLAGSYVKNTLQWRLEQHLEGKPTAFLFETAPKCELLPKEKIAEGKLRSYFMSDVDQNLLLSMTCGSMRSRMIEGRAKGASQSGCNIYKEATQMYKRLKGIKGPIFNSDHKGFDRSLKSTLIKMFFDMLSRNTRKPDKYTQEQWKNLYTSLGESMCNCIILINGNFVYVGDNNWSGSFITTMINDFINELATAYAYITKVFDMTAHYPTLEEYMTDVVVITFGDDKVEAFQEYLGITWDFLVETSKDLGLVRTTATKDGDMSEEIEFISRTFKFCDKHAVVYPALKQSSIIRMTRYFVALEPDLIASNMIFAMFEASFWDEQFFNDVKDDCYAIISRTGNLATAVKQRIPYLTYDNCRAGFAANIRGSGFPSTKPKEGNIDKSSAAVLETYKITTDLINKEDFCQVTNSYKTPKKMDKQLQQQIAALEQQLTALKVAATSAPSGNVTNADKPTPSAAELSALVAQNTTPTTPHNFIGRVQEWCDSAKEKYPNYTFTSEGPDHVKLWTCTCTYKNAKHVAVSHVKKAAQQDAARQLWEVLSSNVTNATRNVVSYMRDAIPSFLGHNTGRADTTFQLGTVTYDVVRPKKPWDTASSTALDRRSARIAIAKGLKAQPIVWDTRSKENIATYLDQFDDFAGMTHEDVSPHAGNVVNSAVGMQDMETHPAPLGGTGMNTRMQTTTGGQPSAPANEVVMPSITATTITPTSGLVELNPYSAISMPEFSGDNTDAMALAFTPMDTGYVIAAGSEQSSGAVLAVLEVDLFGTKPGTKINALQSAYPKLHNIANAINVYHLRFCGTVGATGSLKVGWLPFKPSATVSLATMDAYGAMSYSIATNWSQSFLCKNYRKDKFFLEKADVDVADNGLGCIVVAIDQVFSAQLKEEFTTNIKVAHSFAPGSTWTSVAALRAPPARQGKSIKDEGRALPTQVAINTIATDGDVYLITDGRYADYGKIDRSPRNEWFTFIVGNPSGGSLPAPVNLVDQRQVIRSVLYRTNITNVEYVVLPQTGELPIQIRWGHEANYVWRTPTESPLGPYYSKSGVEATQVATYRYAYDDGEIEAFVLHHNDDLDINNLENCNSYAFQHTVATELLYSKSAATLPGDLRRLVFVNRPSDAVVNARTLAATHMNRFDFKRWAKTLCDGNVGVNQALQFSIFENVIGSKIATVRYYPNIETFAINTTSTRAIDYNYAAALGSYTNNTLKEFSVIEVSSDFPVTDISRWADRTDQRYRNKHDDMAGCKTNMDAIGAISGVAGVGTTNLTQLLGAGINWGQMKDQQGWQANQNALDRLNGYGMGLMNNYFQTGLQSNQFAHNAQMQAGQFAHNKETGALNFGYQIGTIGAQGDQNRLTVAETGKETRHNITEQAAADRETARVQNALNIQRTAASAAVRAGDMGTSLPPTA